MVPHRAPVVGYSGTLEGRGRGITATDGEILAGIFLRLRKMCTPGLGSANPERKVLNMTRNTSHTNPPLKSGDEVTVKRWPILSIRQRRGGGEKASNSSRSRSCAMTVRRPAAAGFSPVARWTPEQHDGAS